jgi:hypothetical protein
MLERWLKRPAAPAVAIVFAVLLQAPSVNTGWVADDHLQRIIMRPERGLQGLPDSRLDLFTFAKSPERNRLLMDQGVFPWTADENVRLAFFRPLSSLTHMIDPSALVGHLHNLLWFALALVAAAFFFRRFLGATPDTKWIAALALTLYAVDDARGPTVSWIANRNALCALALALPSLVFHDRWRKDGWRPGAVLGPLCLALGLFAGESALATCAYLFAYAMHLDRRRIGTLVPYALVLVVWMVLYQKLGYGASGSGVYLDPARAPVAFLRALPSRLSLILLGQFALPWSDFAELYRYLSPRLANVMAVVAAGELALGFWLIRPLLRTSPAARFFTTGLFLAALPICATFPADRLLSFVGIGSMGLIALVIAGRQNRILAGILIAIHLVLAPPLAALRSRSMTTVSRPLDHANDTLPEGLAGKTLVIVNPPSDILTGYLQIMRDSLHQPRPKYLRALAAGTSSVEVERPDANTLLVTPARGFVENITEHMLRGDDRPITRVSLTGMTAEVTARLPDGRPSQVRFTFDTPLDDPSFVWAQWLDGRYRPWSPPPVSTRVTLPASDFIQAMFPK